MQFFSLDAASLATVTGARGMLGLPYHHADVTVARAGATRVGMHLPSLVTIVTIDRSDRRRPRPLQANADWAPSPSDEPASRNERADTVAPPLGPDRRALRAGHVQPQEKLDEPTRLGRSRRLRARRRWWRRPGPGARARRPRARYVRRRPLRLPFARRLRPRVRRARSRLPVASRRWARTGPETGRARRARPRFAGMDPDRQREIARMGGIAAHRSGHAHEWDSREARRYGHMGGIASHRNR